MSILSALILQSVFRHSCTVGILKRQYFRDPLSCIIRSHVACLSLFNEPASHVTYKNPLLIDHKADMSIIMLGCSLLTLGLKQVIAVYEALLFSLQFIVQFSDVLCRMPLGNAVCILSFFYRMLLFNCQLALGSLHLSFELFCVFFKSLPLLITECRQSILRMCRTDLIIILRRIHYLVFQQIKARLSPVSRTLEQDH